MSPPIPDYTGRVLGNWTLTQRLGEGSFGAVYQAENRAIPGRLAAVKVLHPHMALDPDIKRRFINEASAASRADHENIVQVFDGNLDENGLCYLVMELLRGGATLHQLVSQGPLPLPRLCNIGAQIAGALQAAHDQGIVHRDLKPENIMIVPRPRDPDFVKVLDFGVAKLRTAQTAPATMTVVGTANFMAPEQWQPRKDIDGRADIYALGLILYECLAGALPYQAETMEQWCYVHLMQPLPDPVRHAGAPPWLARLLVAMTAKAREERPPSMEVVRQALLQQAWPADEAALTVPVARQDPPARDTVVSGAQEPLRSSTLSRGSGQTLPRLRTRRVGMIFGGAALAGATLLGWGAMHRPTPQRPAAQVIIPSPKPTRTEAPATPGVPAEMAVLGPGRFLMGRPAPSRGRTPPDGPAHEVTVGRFALGKYEVSMADYRGFAEDTKLTGPLPWDGVDDFQALADLPVNQVTQAQAARYCAWRYPAQHGRLPTEAEWEFAARDGGAQRRFPWGERIELGRANAGSSKLAALVPVQGLPGGATAAGIHHLIGNVAEWTSGPATAYPGGLPVPPGTAVVRGGGLDTPLSQLSVTWRSYVKPTAAGPAIGFRCAFSLP